MTKRVNALSLSEINKKQNSPDERSDLKSHDQDSRNNQIVRKRRRPGQRALEEIKKYQHTTQLLIPESYFRQVVKEIANEINPSITFERSALLALQQACEAVAIGTFEDGNLLCIHAHRVTVMPKDIILSKVLKG